MRRREWKAIRNWMASHAAATAAIVGLVALLSGLTILLHASRIIDDAALQANREGLRDAVAEQRRATLAAVVDLVRRGTVEGEAAAPDEPDAIALDQVATVADGVILVQGGRAGSTVVDPLRDALVRLAKPVAEGAVQQASAFVTGDDAIFDAAAVASMAPGSRSAGSRPVVVGLRRIDANWLGRIALLTDVRAPHLVRIEPHPVQGTARMSLGQARDFGIAWRPDAPGARIIVPGAILMVLLTVLSATVFVVQARRAAAEALTRAAASLPAGGYDWLSGLPNRVYFNHVLERELNTIMAQERKIALFHVDIDRFRDVNDAVGIAVGDAMIQAVTLRLATLMRPCDLFARFEGDAFLILQRDIHDPQDCEHLARQLLAAMRDPFDIDGARLTASLSIGVAIAPDDATERADLMEIAHLALVRAKREGHSRMAFHKPMMQEERRRLKSIETELREAIDHEGLVLRYQPIVASDTGKTVCVEALVRWQHPTEGLIAPDRFIGVAENCGLILPLGEWVLRRACLDARDWPGIRVAVNVSPIQFRHPAFVETVCLILEETGLDPSRLELELTEGVLVENEEEAFVAIADLRDRGVRMALDDFGTGYSSLIYLRRFSFDKIKIDRAFIEALEPKGESAILVDSVVRLGRALGLTVTAEGIETVEQRDFLKALACDELQGYLISRPLSNRDLGLFFGGEAPSGSGFGGGGPTTVLAVA